MGGRRSSKGRQGDPSHSTQSPGVGWGSTWREGVLEGTGSEFRSHRPSSLSLPVSGSMCGETERHGREPVSEQQLTQWRTVEMGKGKGGERGEGKKEGEETGTR